MAASYTPIARITTSGLARFWSKVDKQGPEDCWRWNGSPDKDGYGSFSDAKVRSKAHRFAYFIHHGKDPGALVVCHKCENPICVMVWDIQGQSC